MNRVTCTVFECVKFANTVRFGDQLALVADRAGVGARVLEVLVEDEHVRMIRIRDLRLAGIRFGHVGGVTPKPLNVLSRNSVCPRVPSFDRVLARFRPGMRE